VDGTGDLVGDPNLAAVGSERWRHYSWSFNTVEIRIGRKQGGDLRDNSSPVNPKDGALLARDDHVISKCAKVVERNPVVVRCKAGRPKVREQRGDT